MRPIGRLQDENQAKRLGDFLYAKGIENQVDLDLHGAWEVWILDDVNVERAKQAFDQFARDPDDPRFMKAAQTAAPRKQQDPQTQVGKRVRTIDARTIFYAPPVPIGILSIVLIVVGIGVTLLTDFGKKDRFVEPLSITQHHSKDGYVYWQRGLPEIRHGEIWRLFTPMFLHLGLLHIFFNMLFLRDLGSMIEARKSSWMLLVLVLVIAGISNCAQYVIRGPNFGGMSGVVYGLFGYIWMQGKFNPASKLSLEPQTVTFMIVWFFLCLSGLVGNIANAAHAVGLGVGIVWGFLGARWSVLARRG